jgi:hypothetical protein
MRRMLCHRSKTTACDVRHAEMGGTHADSASSLSTGGPPGRPKLYEVPLGQIPQGAQEFELSSSETRQGDGCSQLHGQNLET